MGHWDDAFRYFWRNPDMLITVNACDVVTRFDYQPRRTDMSNNDKLNESIRAKLLERCEEFGCVYLGNVLAGAGASDEEEYCWPSWNTQIVDECGKSLVILRDWIHSCAFTPTELRYIHEKLSPEAWDKLGLELPDRLGFNVTGMVWDAAKQKLARSMLPGLDAGKNCCDGIDCGQCLLREVADISAGCWSDGRGPERADILRKVLDAQLPPLEYEVPVLNAEERKHVEEMSKACNNSCRASLDKSCDPGCYNIIAKIFGRSDCAFNAGADLGSPKRKQITDALQDVIDQQESLLPPHNVVKFEREVSDGWVKWLACEKPEDTCPRANDDPRGNNLCKKQCGAVFPDLEPGLRGRKGLYCPCHQYSPEITRVVIEKCVALGVKFEEYDVWDDLTGEKFTVVADTKSTLSLSNKTCVWRGTYTLTPPKEEFKSYLAVWMFADETRIVLITSTDKDCVGSSNGSSYFKENITPITNPRELHDMLHEMSGEKGMVEEIKAYCQERSREYIYGSVYRELFDVIAQFEGKVK